MEEKLEFNYPKTMDDVVRKDRIRYQQMKQKNEGSKGVAAKKMRNFPPNRNEKNMHGRNNQQRTFQKFARNPPKTHTFTENRQPEGIKLLLNNQQNCHYNFGDAKKHIITKINFLRGL